MDGPNEKNANSTRLVMKDYPSIKIPGTWHKTGSNSVSGKVETVSEYCSKRKNTYVLACNPFLAS